MSEKTPMLATKRRPLGKPGGPGLFRDKNLDLPPYVQNIAHSLMRKRGLPKSQAIQMALGAVERWKDGGGDVSPEVRAAAAKAWAQWEASKAKAKATPNKTSKHVNDTLAMELAQPRVPAGSVNAGQWWADRRFPDGPRATAVPAVTVENLDQLRAELQAVAADTKLSSAERAGAVRELLLTAARSGVVDLAVVHQWKHGWIPLTPLAAAIKAKMARGSARGKGPDLPKGLQKRAAELHSKHGRSVVRGSYGHSKAPVAKTPSKPRTSGQSVVADAVAADRRKPAVLSDVELREADQALAARAGQLGKPGAVSREHRAVKAELGKRSAATRSAEASKAPAPSKPALSTREKRAYSRAYQPGVQGNHAAGMKAVEHFRSTEEGRADQRSGLNIEEHRTYRQAAKDITDPAAAHKAGMAAVAPMRKKRDEERVAKEAEQKTAQQRADVELRKRMADSKTKAAAMGLEIDPSRPQQQLVRQNGKTIGVLEARVKDPRRKEGSRPALVDEEPDMYVSRVAGSHTSKVGGGQTSVVSKQHASMDDALAHVKQHHTTDSKRAQKDLQGGLFEVPKASKAPKSSKPHEIKEGDVGGPIKFAGGRTGTVWSEAPQGGKWVIPDDRKTGEAHAIYVDKSGKVRKDLSSAVYQKDWLRGQRRKAEASTPKARKAEKERQAKLKDVAENARAVKPGARPFANLSDSDLSEIDREFGHLQTKETVGVGHNRYGNVSQVVQQEKRIRAGETKVAEYRKTALKDVSPADRAAYDAAYKRHIADGESPEQAHRDALRDMMVDRSMRRTSLSSRPSRVVELAQVIHQIRKAKVRAA
ncbi:hypothetical protein [Saccharopolyspora sp. NPDC002376]